MLRHAHERLGERLWVAPSCSLRDTELQDSLSFAAQKCAEVALLVQAVNRPGAPEVLAAFGHRECA